jgi:hypothetical protein
MTEYDDEKKKKESKDEQKLHMEHGDEDEDVYTDAGREQLVEDDEIDALEAGIMQGASDDGQLGKDALTGEPLMDIEDVVELEIDGELYRFVSEENAEEFRLKKLQEKL